MQPAVDACDQVDQNRNTHKKPRPFLGGELIGFSPTECEGGSTLHVGDRRIGKLLARKLCLT